MTDSCGVAFYEFGNEIGVKYKAANLIDLQIFSRMIRGGIMLSILLDGLVIICRRPHKVVRDQRNNLHNPTGPAVSWLDGYKNYFWHGISIEPWIVEEPQKITAELVLKESNAETRRAMVEKMGLDKFMHQANPIILDTDKDASGMPRQLMQIQMTY